MPTLKSIVLDDVSREVLRAMQLHPSMANAHEAYAVILEELDEFKEQVWKKQSKRDPMAMRMELIQVAAMAVRAVLDLDLTLAVSPLKKLADEMGARR